SNSVLILLTLGLFIPWARVRMVRYRLGQLQLRAVGDLDDFVAGEEQKVSAVGQEIGDVFDLEVGI
ncbi:MAG: YjgN family protein, partial [Pseudomonadota bacterium]|nr:YjgN family protein [Pseudomonadota bacterium]